MIQVKQLQAQLITVSNFQPYGQLITPSEHGKLYDSKDAQLSLNQGIPRFYIMQLHQRGLRFHHITRHTQCTQCLGSLDGKDWFIAVAPPCDAEIPNVDRLTAFYIPSNCFIKLEVGTWHAGPYFEHLVVDFYNLELSDTNVIDHFTYDFLQKDNLEFEIVAKMTKKSDTFEG